MYVDTHVHVHVDGQCKVHCTVVYTLYNNGKFLWYTIFHGIFCISRVYNWICNTLEICLGFSIKNANIVHLKIIWHRMLSSTGVTHVATGFLQGCRVRQQQSKFWGNNAVSHVFTWKFECEYIYMHVVHVHVPWWSLYLNELTCFHNQTLLKNNRVQTSNFVVAWHM